VDGVADDRLGCVCQLPGVRLHDAKLIEICDDRHISIVHMTVYLYGGLYRFSHRDRRLGQLVAVHIKE
jgi:hypothetical protein